MRARNVVNRAWIGAILDNHDPKWYVKFFSSRLIIVCLLSLIRVGYSNNLNFNSRSAHYRSLSALSNPEKMPDDYEKEEGCFSMMKNGSWYPANNYECYNEKLPFFCEHLIKTPVGVDSSGDRKFHC